MKFSVVRWVAAVLGVGSILLAGPVAKDPLSPAVRKAVEQFREFYLGPNDAFAMRDTNEQTPDPTRARRFAETLREDGSWAEVDYASGARSAWPAAAHYTRMAAMITAAGRRGVAAEERTALLGAAHRAFAYWIAHDFQCPNWWYNEIGTPKLLGTCALLLGDELTEAERGYATGTLLSRFKIGRTGQNKVWLAGNTLRLGLLTGDEVTIAEAAAAIWSEVRVSSEEGIQADFSFHQHGAQQQFGNYGMAFAVETARWGGILRGTPWQLPPEKLAIFRGYLLDGQNWVSWRGAMDISACGRQFRPDSPREKTENIAVVMARTAEFDADRAADYRAFVARNHPGAPNDFVGHRYFWRSDYLIHRRPDFVATLKLSSNRVIGAELVNSENLSGYHTADGGLYFYRTGDEYAEIFPVWDWRKLPGVTCAQTAVPAFKTSQVPSDFVGGVSDGADGLSALDYVRDGVQARKAWFFAGDTVVCLGAGIEGRSPATIATALNQCLLRGPVRVRSGGAEKILAAGSHALTDVMAVEHDGWRYTLLEGGNLHLDAGPVTGNWHRVFDNPDAPEADVTREIFSLWLDHGNDVHAGHYAYAVAPGDKKAADFQVLENSAAKQAVRWGGAKTGAVFWTAGDIELPERGRLAVDAPCLVWVDGKKIRVVDPTQKLAALQLSVDGVVRTVEFPVGAMAGTAVVVE